MMIRANRKPHDLDLLATAVELEAAAPDVEGNPPRRFTMTAYTGGTLQLQGWRFPVVVELKGLDIGSQKRPILLDHKRDVDFVLGQTDKITATDQLTVAGLILGDSPKAQQVINLNDRGFSWQASIGAKAHEVEFIPEGRKTHVNGKEFAGPVHVARKATLGEISFVILGADDNTTAHIAAHEEPEVPTTPSAAPNPPAAPPVQPALQASPPQNPSVDMLKALQAADDAIKAMRTEGQRIANIRKICANHPEIEAKAIAEGWDTNRTELEVIRVDRPTPTLHIPRQSPVTAQVLEAACYMTAGLTIDGQYDDKTLDLAGKRFRGSIGLQELFLEAAWANGYTGRNFRDHREVMRYAFGRNIEAGFSTIDIGGILSNVANKFLLEGFFSVERTWRNICAIRNVSDFKTVTSYRLVGNDQYEKVPPGGEIKHGTLGEETYSNRADTYALMLTIDRRDMINDDLGAITTVPRKLGRGSGLKINDVFWREFLDNSTSFFSVANKNYLTGADTALGIEGLTKAEVAFMDQVDSDGKPIGIMPSILLVPTALSAVGTQLFKSVELRSTVDDQTYPVANPHQGKFRNEVSRYLSNATYPGNSPAAWYLIADPNDLPLIEVCFLNGAEGPNIETAEADFNVLGVQLRGHSDFGCSKCDPRACVKMLGVDEI